MVQAPYDGGLSTAAVGWSGGLAMTRWTGQSYQSSGRVAL